MTTKMDIGLAEYIRFLDDWKSGKLSGLRFGQAFYNHFKLNKMSDQDRWGVLYECDKDTAAKIIVNNFRMI